MRLLFIMDPVHTVLVDADTTYDLMRSAESLGHEVFCAQAQDLVLDKSSVLAFSARARTDDSARPPIGLDTAQWREADFFDVIWIRKDPPFDASYLWMTLILEHARKATRVINDPRGLREANEKLYACWFSAWMPDTWVGANRDALMQFVSDVGGRAVVKPVDGHGGSGVFVLRLDDPNKNVILDTLTMEGTRAVMVQRFIPEVTKGDKRILLVGGEAIGAINRVPKGGDIRSNIHVGGSVERATLSARDRDIVEALAPRLREDGLWFVGLDVVGGYLTEVNVTSPTGIQQMSRLDNKALGVEVIRKLERR